MMVTISDVAARAQVSTATVSRVLNGITVRADLTEAVHQAAKELEYFPNHAARSLRRQHGEIIALILPDIGNPFFTALARGVEDVAQRSGFSVVLCNSDDDPEKEQHYLRIAVSENMAGVVIAPAAEATDLHSLTERGRAVVVVDRPVRDDVDHVLIDNIAVARRAVSSLLDRGFDRIGCITGPREVVTARDRAAGGRQGLADRGFGAPEELLVYANFRVDGGREAMEVLQALAVPPQAVLATNNLVGVGALQTLAEGPDQTPRIGVAVIGDLPFATSKTSGLSLFPLNPREIGLIAARMLVERINGEGGHRGRRVMLPDSA